MMVSGLIVALAPNDAIFMAGRALLGVVIGGFWSMSAATVMRLVPESQVPRALAMLNGGNALATTIAAPLGSFLGQYIGWRGAFFCGRSARRADAGWQFLTLPSMPSARRAAAGGSVFGILRLPQVALGMIAVRVLLHGAVRAVHLPAPIPGNGHSRERFHALLAAAGHGHRRSPGHLLRSACS